VQSFFRASVLVTYEHRCALSGIAVPELLTASHIIPWSADETRRADPRNGLCLNSLYDRAFDRGLISFDDDLRVVLSPRLRRGKPPPLHEVALLRLEGKKLTQPDRFPPDAEAIRYHRERVFQCA
jgi:predicted restriction endonuclease